MPPRNRILYCKLLNIKDNLQSKILFLTLIDRHLSTVKSVLDFHLPGVRMCASYNNAKSLLFMNPLTLIGDLLNLTRDFFLNS